MANSVLIIDDEKKICSLLARIIGLEGFTVFQANTGKEGLKILKAEDIQVVLSDVKLPDINGVELVKEIKKIRPYTEVINLTAFGTIADGVMAMRNGAFDYITKGDDNDKIIPLVYKAMDKARLNYRVYELESKISRKYSFESILGKSRAITESINLARKVAVTDTTVLLLGETGTGKEVFAQAIHQTSPRISKPFVAVNCSGFNPELLESELFGYLAGAFTGAVKDKKGLIEEADEGTIFLDEIGEMNMDLQAKLLRVLENQTYIKVGATQTSKVNVRIIAATNRDLKKEAEKGNFRLDLYYRLSIFTIELPPLTHRKEDILLIAQHYLREFTAKVNKPEFSMEKEFSRLLLNHNWKGNIRELKNVMERVVILAEESQLGAHLLPYEFHNEHTTDDPFNMQAVEKQHIVKVLHYTHGNKTETARLLGIGLTTLYRKIEEYQLEK
ncbi:sigma-54-dependent transcriptional regulator [Pedobacter antarcticus]|uniref:Chemotaxis protein CheY n=2 Tax=Pedobacter antarcticus TaxID=34086 RepID=A0A081PFU0_9SPHI|nr:sigma-54 dependent transcriptional regulator [Pedobacter antarcticus]KEQ29563.1 chemotaxis protein CheY [Pedobacter antarcticus 4BY]SDM21318.1 DNA-binding transcriptional response regulator, NtrC family, contains REC, AAA-type ATPase, and a Fis-type DNA-binding domains [Pedobacter antarcticus]SFF09925.1 DNA-binding transcriptional response regulator, NtrC family, contains REC, AAA-type ATPase, and a Fis-type DNA-binding domains [Pedobacter antarcticus]